MNWFRFVVKSAVALALLALLAVASAFGKELRVVTSTAPLYCFTVNVAGSLAKVENLLPPGAGAHDFQFTSKERRRLEQADLVLLNGLGLESWIEKRLKEPGSKPALRCAEGFEKELIPPQSKTPNPHVWLDPMLACRMVTNILVALQRADPANALAYATNAAAFVRRLEKLDEEFRAGLAALPGRTIITAHDAFPYFARRYHLTVAGVLEVIAEIDPSPAHLAALRGVIQKQSVKAIFVDTHDAGRKARRLRSDFKIAVGVLDTLEEVPLKPTAYEDGMRRNLDALRETIK